MNDSDLILIRAMIQNAVKDAVKEERERLATILEMADIKFRYSYDESGGLDLSATLDDIAQRIRKGE